MTNTPVYATSETFNLLVEAAASTRRDNMDASPDTVLRSYVEMAKEVERVLWGQVQTARSMGLTWQQIGDQFGITRQAAQQRFGH